jgi:hypothetical protein
LEFIRKKKKKKKKKQFLVEFDLATSRLSFTGPLYFFRTSCGNFG